ncbi:hypothetical protein D3C71_1401940 [compost metagenome]
MAEHEAGRTHHRGGVVGGDFPGVALRFLPGFGGLGVVALGLDGDGFAHRVRFQHLVHQQAAGGKIRADDRFADTAEVGAQHALQLAHGALGLQPFVHGFTQRHRRSEADDGVAAVEQHRQQAAEAADQRPVFREQHREPAALLVRGAADEDRHRHQVHVQLAAGAMRLQDLGQRVRVGLGATLLGDQRVAAAPARQGEVGALAPGRIAGDRHQRRGQAGFAAGLVQDQRVGQTVVLQHVDHRAAVVVLAGVFGLDLQRQPRLDQAAEQARPPRRATTGRTGAGHDRGRHDGGGLRIHGNGLHGRASGRWNRSGSTVGRHGSG